MSRVDVIRVRNAFIFDAPEIVGLFKLACKGTYFAGGDVEAALQEFRKLVVDADAGVFIGFEDYTPRGLFLISPPFPLFPVPQVWHAFNQGSKGLKKAMMQAGIAFLKDKGYNKIHAVNGTGIETELWKRVFGLRSCSKSIGTMHEIDINELRV